jgi:hypothetical protein
MGFGEGGGAWFFARMISNRGSRVKKCFVSARLRLLDSVWVARAGVVVAVNNLSEQVVEAIGELER